MCFSRWFHEGSKFPETAVLLNFRIFRSSLSVLPKNARIVHREQVLNRQRSGFRVSIKNHFMWIFYQEKSRKSIFYDQPFFPFLSNTRRTQLKQRK